MKTLDELIKAYEADFQANQTSLLEYQEAKAYFHGNQLPQDAIERITKRGAPPIIENIYKMIINKILGYKAQSISEVKVYGRQEQDKHLANLLNDLLKVFNQSKEYDREILKRDRDLIFGLSCVELWVKQRPNGDTFIEINHIPTDCILIDKYSNDINALDATRIHKKVNISYDLALEMFGSKARIDYENGVDKRTYVCESWFYETTNKDDKSIQSWNRYIWSKDYGIYSYEVMPFKTNTHPFIIAKYQIDDKNRWYGLFRDIKPFQDFINLAENRITNIMGTYKAMIEEDAVVGIEEFVENFALDDAVIKVRSGALKDNKIQIINNQADINNLTQKAEQKRALAKILSGLNDEALGVAINRQSGVAIAQRRDAGIMGLQTYIKTSDDMDRYIYEKVINLIQHYFTKEQVFKIVDEKIGVRYFSINQNAQNKIQVGDFDLVYKTQLKSQGREERFAHWSEMIKTIAQIRPDLVPDLLPLMLKDTDSPIVEDLQELLENKAKEAQAQAEQAQAQAKAQEAQLLAEHKAQVQEKQAKADKYQAQAELIEKATKGETEFSVPTPKPSLDLR